MLNKVQLIGRLGGQPEIATTQGGLTIAKFSLATSESFKDKQTGQKREDTEWHRIVMFGKLAEIANQYLQKGGLVFIEGKIKTQEWEKDGVKRWTTEIIANEMKMLGGKDSSQQPQQQRQQAQPRQQAPAANGYQQQYQRPQAQVQQQQAPQHAVFDDSETIPF